MAATSSCVEENNGATEAKSENFNQFELALREFAEILEGNDPNNREMLSHLATKVFDCLVDLISNSDSSVDQALKMLTSRQRQVLSHLLGDNKDFALMLIQACLERAKELSPGEVQRVQESIAPALNINAFLDGGEGNRGF